MANIGKPLKEIQVNPKELPFPQIQEPIPNSPASPAPATPAPATPVEAPEKVAVPA